MNHFENGRYFDYHARKWRKPSNEQIARFKSARAEFLADVKRLAENIQEVESAGTPVTHEEIQMGLQWCVTDWAKKARASELFSGF